ncbi:MAG: carbohydrate kinase [Oscillospiraceae bacterium]
MADIVAVGEILVDLTQKISENGEITYSQSAGGASANVAVMAAKLGVPAGFIGKVGRDMFGSYLKNVLEENNVNTKGLILDDKYSTPLAFVRKNEDGEREFHFVRNDSKGSELTYAEINKRVIDNCKIFHFGSRLLTSEPSRAAVMLCAEYAKNQGKIISFDPNFRRSQWESQEDAVRTIQSAMKYVDILKVSEDELLLVSGFGNMATAIAKLIGLGVKVICITQGAKGCIVATKSGINNVPSFKAEIVDTMGAGDSFFGAFLSRISRSPKPLSEIETEELINISMYSNACGALSAGKLGAIPAMPTDEEIRALIKQQIKD